MTDEHEKIPRRVPIAFITITVIFVILATVMAMQFQTVRNSVSRLERLEREQAAFRKARLAQTSNTDRSICFEVQKLKIQNRQDAKRSFKNLDQNLALLGIKKTSTIVAVARRELNRTLKINKLRNCNKLPSAKPPKIKTK